MARLRPTHTKAFGPTSVPSANPVALWTPAAGKVARLMGGAIASETTGTVHILDGSASPGTIGSLALPANESIPFDLGNGARATAAGTAIFIQHSAGAGINVTGALYGREE